MRLGIVYDPYRISKVQKQGAISLGVEFYAKLQVSCRASILAVQVVILTLIFCGVGVCILMMKIYDYG